MSDEQSLPDDWRMVRFDEVVESSLYGCNPTNGEDVDGIPFLRISDITADGKLKYQELPKNADLDGEDAEKYGLDLGDVVVARSGSVGQSYVYNPQHGKMVYASYLIRFTLDVEQVRPDFIKMYFQSPMYWRQVHRNSHAAAQPNLNAGEIKDFVVPLPPIDEQDRIVSALEDEITSLNRVVELSEQVNERAEEFINAVTNRQFDTDSSHIDWGYLPLGEIAEFQNGYAFSKDEWTDEGLPIIRIQNLTGTGDEYNHFKGVVPDRYYVHPGDILFAWSGTIDAFRWSGEKAVLNQHIYKVIPDSEQVCEDYVYWLLKYGASELEQKKQGAALQHITKGMVTEFEVPVPPIEEQKRIVSLLEEAIGHAGCVASNATQMEDYAEELRGVLFQRAFSGELLDK